MSYESSYEVELELGFALLEKAEGPQGPERFRAAPSDGVLDQLMLRGVYGGRLDPDREQEFFVYNVQWPEEVEMDEELFELLSEELDSLFPGWVYDGKKDKIYILQEGEIPSL
jgi:hypothetical protein